MCITEGICFIIEARKSTEACQLGERADATVRGSVSVEIFEICNREAGAVAVSMALA